MLEMHHQGSSIFEDSPSFNSYSSNKFAEIAAKVSEEFRKEREEFGLEAVDEAFSEMSIEDIVVIPDEERKSTDLETIEEEKKMNDNDEVVVVEGDEEQEEEDDFEFAFVCRDPDGSPITADEIFSNGQIRPIFPIFNRDLLFAGGRDQDLDEDEDSSKTSRSGGSSTLRLPLKKLFNEERETHSSSSSEADDLEGLPDGTYCVWTPKPTDQASLDRSKKSSSTGSGSSSSRRWRFRDFLFRSNSDGKDTFVFLTPSASTKSKFLKRKDDQKTKSSTNPSSSSTSTEGVSKASNQAKMAGKSKGKAEASAHEIHYVRNRALKEGDKRKSYLPYRQDLVGFFANVNGLSRNLQPF